MEAYRDLIASTVTLMIAFQVFIVLLTWIIRSTGGPPVLPTREEKLLRELRGYFKSRREEEGDGDAQKWIDQISALYSEENHEEF